LALQNDDEDSSAEEKEEKKPTATQNDDEINNPTKFRIVKRVQRAKDAQLTLTQYWTAGSLEVLKQSMSK
jgi:hypothetical protein